MSTADFLFQNQAPAAWTSPSWTQSQFPEWWQAASQGLITRASQITGEPYQPYSGPRIADIDPLTQQARDSATSYTPRVTEAFGSGIDYLNSGGELFDQENFDQFMNPYTDSVVNRITDLGVRNLSEKLLPAVNDTFTGAGQFGSSRHSDFTNRALRDTNESILGQQSQALESGFRSSMDDYQSALARRIQAGQSLGALGNTIGQEGRAQLESMVGLGNIGQNQDQRNLDLAASDFENQVNYPLRQLEIMNSILRGYSNNLNNTQTRYSAAPIQNAGAAPIAGALGALGAATAGTGGVR